MSHTPAREPAEPHVVIALGKNWRRRPFGLSIESKMIALAAAELYVRGKVGAIILSGGHTASPRRPSEAAAMATYLRRHFPPAIVPESAVFLEEESFDTGSNAQHVGELLARRRLGPTVLLSVSFHVPTAVAIFRASGITIDECRDCELVLRERSDHYGRLVARYRRSPRYQLEVMKERLRALLLRVDPQQRRVRPLIAILRRTTGRW